MKKKFWTKKKFYMALAGVAAAIGIGTATQYEAVLNMLGVIFRW